MAGLGIRDTFVRARVVPYTAIINIVSIFFSKDGSLLRVSFQSLYLVTPTVRMLIRLWLLESYG